MSDNTNPIDDIVYQNLPKDMTIYMKSLESFIPEGRTWDSLTAEEKEVVKNKYRFCPMIPGIYQAITGD